MTFQVFYESGYYEDSTGASHDVLITYNDGHISIQCNTAPQYIIHLSDLVIEVQEAFEDLVADRLCALGMDEDLAFDLYKEGSNE